MQRPFRLFRISKHFLQTCIMNTGWQVVERYVWIKVWYTRLHWSLSNEKICIKFHLDNNFVCKSLRGHLEQWNRYVSQKKTQYGKRKHTHVILLWYRLKLHVCMMENKYERISNQIALKLKRIFAFSSGLFPPSLLSQRAFLDICGRKISKANYAFTFLKSFPRWECQRLTWPNDELSPGEHSPFLDKQQRKTCWSLLAYCI